MGSYNGSVAVDLEYPIAFQESMARVLETKDITSRFRYVILGGKFVRQNQEQKLWFLDKPRKIKVRSKYYECSRSNIVLGFA